MPSPQPTNATKKPIDSSARKSLIYIALTGVPSGLRPALGGEGRRENTQTESKTRRLLAEMHLSVVRKNPQEPAQTRGNRQKKPTGEGWLLRYWWSWRDLNPRPSTFLVQIYMFSVLIWISPLTSCRRTLRNRPVPYCLILSQGTRAKTSRCDYPHSREVLRPPCPAHRPAVVRLTGN